jgi:hypothetical protein
MTTIPRGIARVPSMPGVLLRVEGIAVLIGAITLYANQQGSWIAFVLLLLAPDLSAIGYLVNTHVGSVAYNAVHTYVLPSLLAALSILVSFPAGIQIALIWFAHIGMDRALGFGLKYATAFKDTHLQRV